MASGAQSPNEGLEAASHIIVMVSEDVGGALEFGGGIIFGREDKRLLIATAYHLHHRSGVQPGGRSEGVLLDQEGRLVGMSTAGDRFGRAISIDAVVTKEGTTP